jgi:hypothetical protein
LLQRIDDLSLIKPLSQKPNPPIDLTQASLAVLIIRVLGTITIARSPLHDPNHLRALDIEQLQQLLLQAGVPLRRNVIGRSRGLLARCQ